MKSLGSITSRLTQILTAGAAGIMLAACGGNTAEPVAPALQSVTQ